MANRLAHEVIALDRFNVRTVGELRAVMARLQGMGIADHDLLDGEHSVTVLEETLSDGSQAVEVLIRPVTRY
jgi:hypothetical protein